jgi:hypothetical protein
VTRRARWWLLPVVVAAVLSVSACYFELAARLEKTPVEGMDGSLFRGTTFDLLYTDAGFPTLATIWRALDTGGRYRPPVPAATSVTFRCTEWSTR